ncbi:MAG: FadR family transcriptional regulator [Calditrichaeota bacterium]|nr:MAG: FadR family transcriptional regulator [Calditrichota bacterium]MBL1204744.1 FadR family transcriptional regulator [Calditrichota bacterium]NOG44572.1 FadR family transcriptional regulator [Calditrichota bacterium]
MFTKIGNPLSLSKQIARDIEKSILEKKFIPGQKLPTEMELCDMFDVSRTALREAIKMLSSRGLITVKKGSGIFVEDYSATNVTKPMQLFLELNLDKEYLKHIIEVRKLLEPQIVRLAAVKKNDRDIAEMEKILQDLNDCPKDNFEKEGMLDRNFHLALAKAAGNPMVPMILEPIFQLMPKIKMLIYSKVENAKKAAELYHEKIFVCIKKGDADGAAQAMKEHLRIAEQHSTEIEEELW